MILTLCGSARFEAEFHRWNEALTLAGHTVFSLAVFPSTKEAGKDWYDAATKELLDLAHLRKIQASEGIVVLNVDGYIGPSTQREAAWASSLGRAVYLVEPLARFTETGEVVPLQPHQYESEYLIPPTPGARRHVYRVHQQMGPSFVTCGLRNDGSPA